MPKLDEVAIRSEARLQAIEFAIVEMFALIYRGSKASSRFVHERHDYWIEFVRQHGVPDLDPAESDLLTGELEAALFHLSRAIERHARYPRETQEA